MNKYREKIVCKCGKIHYRDVEVMQTSNTYLEMDQPLNILIVKKFRCDECGKEAEYQIDITKSN